MNVLFSGNDSLVCRSTLVSFRCSCVLEQSLEHAYTHAYNMSISTALISLWFCPSECITLFISHQSSLPVESERGIKWNPTTLLFRRINQIKILRTKLGLGLFLLPVCHFLF